MIIKEMMLGDTKVLIDDKYFPDTEEERQIRYEIFNQIGCEIINSSKM